MGGLAWNTSPPPFPLLTDTLCEAGENANAADTGDTAYVPVGSPVSTNSPVASVTAVAVAAERRRGGRRIQREPPNGPVDARHIESVGLFVDRDRDGTTQRGEHVRRCAVKRVTRFDFTQYQVGWLAYYGASRHRNRKRA